MKRGIFFSILVAVAAVCVILNILEALSAEIFSATMAFPFEQMGFALRFLSLTGSVGNVIAAAVYIVICLLPGMLLFFLRKKRKLYAEDGLLVLFSVVLFVVLYLMINPGLISEFTKGAAGIQVGKAVLGGGMYSILCAYLVLRVLRILFADSIDKLMGHLSIMLSLLGVLFVCLIFGVCLDSFLQSISALRAGNVGSEHLLGTTYVFLGVQFLLDILPYVFNLLIVFVGLRLVQEMGVNRYSEESVIAAQQLSKLCGVALTATVLSNMGFNLLQLLFARSLLVISGSLEIPVFSIVFVLSTLLLTRFITENKQLKDDNDLFV